MKTQFFLLLEITKRMAFDNVVERMRGCDILEFTDNIKGIQLDHKTAITHLKKDKNGVTLYDNDIFIGRLETLNIQQICIISDALN